MAGRGGRWLKMFEWIITGMEAENKGGLFITSKIRPLLFYFSMGRQFLPAKCSLFKLTENENIAWFKSYCSLVKVA